MAVIYCIGKMLCFQGNPAVFWINPSAFSHLVASFEETLGIRLFVRSSTGVELTEEGAALLPKFEAVLDAEADLLNCADTFASRHAHELRIGT